METVGEMTAFPSPEAGWQIALVGAVGTFIALLVLRLIVQAVRAILSRFNLDVEELTYVPPEMPFSKLPVPGMLSPEEVRAKAFTPSTAMSNCPAPPL